MKQPRTPPKSTQLTTALQVAGFEGSQLFWEIVQRRAVVSQVSRGQSESRTQVQKPALSPSAMTQAPPQRPWAAPVRPTQLVAVGQPPPSAAPTVQLDPVGEQDWLEVQGLCVRITTSSHL